MGERIVKFITGAVFLIITYGLCKVDYFIFSILMNMLKAQYILDGYTFTIFLAVIILFIIMVVITAIPFICGSYLVCDTFSKGDNIIDNDTNLDDKLNK